MSSQAQQHAPATATPVPDVVTNPASFARVWRKELRLLQQRRAATTGNSPPPAVRDALNDASGKPVLEAQQTSALGLAFSGGGIRSATFNLGVLQGLSEHGLLEHIDYLSTVSGGGYIGAWLHGVMHRVDSPETAVSRASEVLASGVGKPPGPAGADPISFLRTYSNYLAPRPGLFRADTWAIGFIWLRNVLLNQLVLVPAIAFAVSLTLLGAFLVQHSLPGPLSHGGVNVVAAALALIVLSSGVVVMTGHLRRIAQSTKPRLPEVPPVTHSRSGLVVVPLVGTTLVLLGAARFNVGLFHPFALGVFVVFIGLMASIQLAGGFVDCYVVMHGAEFRRLAYWDTLWISVVTGSLAGLILVEGVWRFTAGLDAVARLTIGPPLVGMAFLLPAMLLIGLMGVEYPDAAREWTARTGSMVAMAIAAWLAWFGLTIYGPWAASATAAYAQTASVAGAVAWLATTGAGVLAGRSPRSDGSSSSLGRAMAALVGLAPVVFLVGYLLIIATAVHLPFHLHGAADVPVKDRMERLVIGSAGDARVELTTGPGAPGRLELMLAPVARFAAGYPGALNWSDSAHRGVVSPLNSPRDWPPLNWMLTLAGLALVTAAVASRRININEFSLHHFYKNRLVRCYLGASKTMKGRAPHPDTGFDPGDDLPLAHLSPDKGYGGPYAIVNATLNLNAGAQLATQERKAASFVFTPAYCGFDVDSTPDGDIGGSAQSAPGDTLARDGYRETAGYAYGAGPSLGTTVAISGAAANPNWGHNTSGPMAFLLTVFNARLGWWLGNPRWTNASQQPGPKFAWRYLFSELVGQTTASSPFVNLSDGGHFDNLGLYELVRRRCRFIVVSDAEQDPDLGFGSLGGAIRKCRADFGVEIDIDTSPLLVQASGFSAAHCVVGRIRYPEDEKAFSAGMTRDFEPAIANDPSRGWLLYLKSSLTGDEPADVLEYRVRHPEFPHQSTADQFFGESQFESYRRLGLHAARSALAGVGKPSDHHPPATWPTSPGGIDLPEYAREAYPLVCYFQALSRAWYAPIPIEAGAATRLADAYVDLVRRLGDNAALALLNEELQKGSKATADGRADDGAATAAELSAGMALMQLVQNVYTEFRLESALNRANPRNSGWMDVFRRWRRSPILMDRVWPRIRDDYHALFQRFVDDLGRPEKPPERP